MISKPRQNLLIVGTCKGCSFAKFCLSAAKSQRAGGAENYVGVDQSIRWFRSKVSGLLVAIRTYQGQQDYSESLPLVKMENYRVFNDVNVL